MTPDDGYRDPGTCSWDGPGDPCTQPAAYVVTLHGTFDLYGACEVHALQVRQHPRLGTISTWHPGQG